MQTDTSDKEKALQLVDCYAGAEYPERPRAFVWEGKQLQILRITAQWKTPAGITFCVISTNQDVFELFFNQTTDSWTVELR